MEEIRRGVEAEGAVRTKRIKGEAKNSYAGRWGGGVCGLVRGLKVVRVMWPGVVFAMPSMLQIDILDPLQVFAYGAHQARVLFTTHGPLIDFLSNGEFHEDTLAT